MILNVNVPNRPPEALAGVRMATLAPFGQVQMAVAESGEGFIRTAIKQSSDERVEGSDIALLADGYATVTAGPVDPRCGRGQARPVSSSSSACAPSASESRRVTSTIRSGVVRSSP